MLVVGAPSAICAQVSDPAGVQIDAFNRGLTEVMKTPAASGRFDKMRALLERCFDLPTMTRFAVGEPWAAYSEADRALLVQAFSRMTAATYAHNFSGYSGERFTLDPKIETRGPDKLVRTQLIAGDSAPVSLTYRMRQAGGTWKVIDVYYNGSISSLVGQRSEFSSLIKSGGPQALVRSLDRKTDQLLKEKP